MAKVSEIYGSGDRLKADDLQGRPWTLRILSHRIVHWEAQDDRAASDRIWLSFLGAKKELQLNVTSARNLADAWGDDCDKWTGKDVMVVPRMTNMGATIDALAAPAGQTPSTGPGPAPEPQPPAPNPAPAPDDCPF
jgi:hypothetical protein